MRVAIAYTAGIGLLLASSAAVHAQSSNLPSVEFTTQSIAAGLTGNKGSGTIKLPNLGAGCAYDFTIDGIGAGLKVGISKVTAQGLVQNMNTVHDFEGGYRKTDQVATLIKGKGTMTLKNQRNAVRMELKSTTQGFDLGTGSEGMTIKLKEPIPDAPTTYYLFFGFNKDHVNRGSRAMLDAFLVAWKCRYGTIRLVGHTDTVGKEDYNLNLSAKRAEAVRKYLVERGGVNPQRVVTRAAGEKELISGTGQGVRRRSNRAVVITIE